VRAYANGLIQLKRRQLDYNEEEAELDKKTYSYRRPVMHMYRLHA